MDKDEIILFLLEELAEAKKENKWLHSSLTEHMSNDTKNNLRIDGLQEEIAKLYQANETRINTLVTPYLSSAIEEEYEKQIDKILEHDEPDGIPI